MKLRPHHALCIQKFTGHGYDERFTAHMTETVNALRVFPGTPIEIVSGCDIADGSRTRTAPRGPFSALFVSLSSPCVSKASFTSPKITRKLHRVECEAVFGGRIFVRARKSPQGILPYCQGL